MIGDGSTARAIRDAVHRGEVTASEIVRRWFYRFAEQGDQYHAFLGIAAERAERRAAEIDRLGATVRSLPLAGVPVAVKDNICTRGLATTAGSRALDGWIPPYDATVVARLESAGAVVVGKTNCDEFAMGSSTEHSAFGPTCNPWGADRTPGGSSGGSAAAVAARQAPIALGSDTGGSVRQPAAFCNIIGLKPTYGRVSRHGLIAFASSLDQIGPMSLTAWDAALVLQAIAGPDGLDSTCAPQAVPDYPAALTGNVEGLRIGVVRQLWEDGLEEPVRRSTESALAALRARGALLVDVDLPATRFGIPVYYLVATAEASSNLARYDGVRYGRRAGDAKRAAGLQGMYEATRSQGFGDEVKRRIMLGTFTLSAGYYDAYYLKAQQVRTLIRRDYDKAFERADLLAMPATPTVPFRLGERVDDPLQMYLADVFTVGASLAGLPALSVPCGFSPDGLPVGLQLVGRPFDEETLLRAADAYEREHAWWQRTPPLTS